jgi:phospholipid-binding lipoprotein MlaA
MIKLKNTFKVVSASCALIFFLSGLAHGTDYLGGVVNVPSNQTTKSDNPSPDDKSAVSDEEKAAVPDNKPAVSGDGKAAVPDNKSTVSDDGTSSDDADDADLFNDEDLGGGTKSILDEDKLVADPLIGYNRIAFAVNDKLYFWCLKPLAQGYKAVTPSFFRTGVTNFFHNLTTPIRFVSSALQGKIKGAGSELGRFVVNTTVGIGGVWDPADKFFGLKPSEEDLGQTFGKYHIGNGFYIVWPFLGPSTLRDSTGMLGDMFLNPGYYLTPSDLAIGVGVFDTINKVSYRIGDYETVKSTSLDPYVMVRDFYIEYRNKKIAE